MFPSSASFYCLLDCPSYLIFHSFIHYFISTLNSTIVISTELKLNKSLLLLKVTGLDYKHFHSSVSLCVQVCYF